MSSFADMVLPMPVAERAAALLELPDSVVASVGSATYGVFKPVLDAFESTIAANLPELYRQVNQWRAENAHPFAAKLPFLSPWHVLFAVIMYFVTIAVFAVVGKILGKGQYRLFALVHNYLLHVVSLYMSVGLLVSARAAGYSLWNNAAGTSRQEWRVAKLVWLFYVSKVPEWIDTVIMLLKQNYRQVSFLHVYHHITIYVIWWMASFMAPGGEAYYSAMVNSGVHVVMYVYYFLTLLFPEGRMRKFLHNFKFVITKGQLTQFALNCVQSVYDLLIVERSQLKYSANLLQLLFWYMITLMVLFGNFLRKNAIEARKHKREQRAAKAAAAADAAGKHNTNTSQEKQNGASKAANKTTKNKKN